MHQCLVLGNSGPLLFPLTALLPISCRKYIMVLDSVLSKTPVHKTELLHLLMKLARCNLCIETMMCPGSREAAHFVPAAIVVCVLDLQEAFSCGVNSSLAGCYLFLTSYLFVICYLFVTICYKNSKPFKNIDSLANP